MQESQLEKVRKEFGQRVRDLRSRGNHSQESFADECGLHRTYVGAIERGERNVSIDNIARIADALDIAIRELF